MRKLLLLHALLAPGLHVLRADDATVMPIVKPGATVIFVGDSITDGGLARTGNDFNHTMGRGYAFILRCETSG